MNKLFLTLTLTGALLGSVSFIHAQDAQPGRGRVTPEERLKRMTESLTLTQEQQDKIKAIFEKNKSKLEEARKAPEDQRREKVREAQKAQQEEISAVLTQEQKDKQKAQMEKRRAERQAGGGGAAKPDAPK
jgi:Spy/CpxP family protein refolding chaperone